MKRNRIVINLDSNQPLSKGAKSSSRGGWGRPLLIIAFLLFLVFGGVAAGGYFWWRHYRSSPAYSLALLADASQRNDTATIDSILDTDKISADVISQVRQRTPGSSIVSLLPNELSPVTPAVSTKMRESVHAEAIKELQRVTDIAAGKPLVVVALAIPWYADIKQENDTAHATVNIKDEQIQLTMQRDGERWRIVAVKDDNLTKILANAAARALPSSVHDEANKQWDKLQNRK